MGIGGLHHHQAAWRATLLTAAALALGGLVALVAVEGGATPTPRSLTPNEEGSRGLTSWSQTGTTATTRARTRMTWRASPTTTRRTTTTRNVAPSPTTSPPAARPTAQVDVAVPAAGAQASAGDGDGSCTTVQMTAITPEGCPPPSGDGPVVVGYQTPPGGENGSFIGARFA